MAESGLENDVPLDVQCMIRSLSHTHKHAQVCLYCASDVCLYSGHYH